MVNNRRSLKRNRSIETEPLSATDVNVTDPITSLKLETENVDSHHVCQASVSCENCAPQCGEQTKLPDSVPDPMTCSVEKIQDLGKRASRKDSGVGEPDFQCHLKSTKKRGRKKQVNGTLGTCEDTINQKKRPKVSEHVDGILNKSNEIVCHSSGLLEKTATGADSLEVLNSTPTSQSDIVNHKLKTSVGRLSLKNRKDELVAPIFKQTPASKQSGSERAALSETHNVNDQGTADLVPVSVAAAPALVNLGNTCFFNSIIQTLFYTPAFVDSVAVLASEILATTRDNDVIATLEKSSEVPLSGFPCWKFVERLHEVMKKAADRFASGCADIEPISPTAVLTQLETMNSLFSGGHQQDAHELLRCILSYVQDSVKHLNNHRLALSAAVRFDELQHSAAKISEVKVGTTNSRKSEGDGSSNNTETKAKRRRSGSSMCEATEPGPTASVARITNFFVRAAPKPKSVSEIPVKTQVLADLVVDGFEGVVERKTRCLECERVTKCEEVFQDVEVVVHKNGTKDVVKEDYEGGEESCWIVKSLEEVERLQGDNKYWCTKCEHHVEAERSVEFHQVPEVLTIQMKRFSAFSSWFHGGFTKTMDCVTVPFEMQCLEKQCRRPHHPPSHRYELFGVLSHTGVSLSSGHYVTYVRSLTEARLIEPAVAIPDKVAEPTRSVSIASCVDGPWWYACDDETVTALTQSDLERRLSAGGASTPYLLFYRRVQRTTLSVDTAS